MSDHTSGKPGSSDRHDSAVRAIEENRLAVNRTQAGVEAHLNAVTEQMESDRAAIASTQRRLDRAAKRRQARDGGVDTESP